MHHYYRGIEDATSGGVAERRRRRQRLFPRARSFPEVSRDQCCQSVGGGAIVIIAVVVARIRVGGESKENRGIDARHQIVVVIFLSLALGCSSGTDRFPD